MLSILKKKTKSLSHFIWLILLITITVLVTYFYEKNTKSQYEPLKKTLNNIYFQKTLIKLSSELENRFKELEYIVKLGDTYESIIKNIEIPKEEKKKFLKL